MTVFEFPWSCLNSNDSVGVRMEVLKWLLNVSSSNGNLKIPMEIYGKSYFLKEHVVETYIFI